MEIMIIHKLYSILCTKYLLFIIIICHLTCTAGQAPRQSRCVTGYMTDVQRWVDGSGRLRARDNDTMDWVDLSSELNPVPLLLEQVSSHQKSEHFIKYLSMANCGLSRIPSVFNFRNETSRSLADTVQYMTFYGNAFSSSGHAGEQYSSGINATGAMESAVFEELRSPEPPSLWSAGFQQVIFPHLKELDLRACSIQIIHAQLLRGMSNLEALYIGENEIHVIESRAFDHLPKLTHLDFSRNKAVDDKGQPLNLQADSVFSKLSNLVTLDLSHTVLTQRNVAMFKDVSNTLKSLSLCNTGLPTLPTGTFRQTPLEILDVSQNNGILSQQGALSGLQDTLKVLYASGIGVQTFDMFRDFHQLEVLQLGYNEISLVKAEVISTLESLKILDLDKNRVTTWFLPTYEMAPNLELLSLRDNNINVILEEMVWDMANISYLALSGNFMVCNCYGKEFYKMASMNEMKSDYGLIRPSKTEVFHTAYLDYNSLIQRRNILEDQCGYPNNCEGIVDSGRFRLIDYYSDAYTCLMVPDSRAIGFSEVDGCSRLPREMDIHGELATGRRTILALLAIPCLLLPLVFIFVFRRNLKYCLITMRNSAMIGLINKNSYDDGAIFNYDVFVSYCNEDRAWVLNQLLPHLESDCSISACLHERDFQVGLSILENIVSCIDRSRSIMLVISQQFLLSQWCQFEMHLAQHRLLETRREDLTLVLLEDIPRRLRPNTLHYLMLTKTYIVWPKQEAEKPLFWKRLQRSLLTHKIKYTDNVSVV